MATWRDKAHREIARLSYSAWHKANHDKRGRRYKRHRPYSIPEDAEALVECLNTDDEERAKAIFVWRLLA